MRKQNNTRRSYENGYLPKIAYHMGQGNMDKVEFFTSRQVDTYGPLTGADMVTIMNEIAENYG